MSILPTGASPRPDSKLHPQDLPSPVDSGQLGLFQPETPNATYLDERTR